MNKLWRATFRICIKEGHSCLHFRGIKKELEALVAYIKQLQSSGESLQGAQSEGVVVNPINAVDEVAKRIEADLAQKEQEDDNN